VLVASGQSWMIECRKYARAPGVVNIVSYGALEVERGEVYL
jgi:hypothetical protein